MKDAKRENNSYAYLKFKQLCKERNVTPYQVAIGTNKKISTSLLSQWKSGLYNLKLDKLYLIADYFGVPVTEFVEPNKETEPCEEIELNELQVFNSKEFGQIRTVTIDNKPWFVASDVARALGYTNPRDAVARHCKGVAKHDTPTSSGTQLISYINEGDVYRLIMKSKLPSAEKFESWVMDEVLPSIRKSGGYIAGQEQMSDAELMAKALLVAQKQIEQRNSIIEQQKAKIEEDRPKTIFADAVATSKTSILIGDLAKLICQNGYQIGQKRLFEWMRENGYLIKSGSSKNMPTQRYVEQGLFEIKESSVQNPDGSVRITKTTKVTGKGQIYFVNKFTK